MGTAVDGKDVRSAITASSFTSPFTATPATRPYHVATERLAGNQIAGSWAQKQKVGFSK
jgi:hypothetical protein